MFIGTIAPPKQPEIQKAPSVKPVFNHTPTDMWVCRTHEGIGLRGTGRARLCHIINNQAIPKLIAAAGGWEELCIQLADDLPAQNTLAAMRELMGVDPYWEEVKYREPTQIYVAKMMRDYIEWYVTHHGEPRNPARLTNGATGESGIIKEPEKQEDKGHKKKGK